MFKLENLAAYGRLIRFERPIGTLLVLWPCLWGLWLAAGTFPSLENVLIFAVGAFVMRSAGCAINDYADRHIDGKVERTRQRPLATGEISEGEALGIFAILIVVAFGLVLMTNTKTVLLAFAGLGLAALYPFTKRFFHSPQLVLGAAFAWPIPMAFSAETNNLPSSLWLLFAATFLWIVVYDTYYAMADRADDLKIGVNSTAILFGHADLVICAILQLCVLLLLVVVGRQFACGGWYYAGLLAAALLFVYQNLLVQKRAPEQCFKAFLNNNYVGMAIFTGILLDHWPAGY